MQINNSLKLNFDTKSSGKIGIANPFFLNSTLGVTYQQKVRNKNNLCNLIK